jgi:hypothetical protein
MNFRFFADTSSRVLPLSQVEDVMQNSNKRFTSALPEPFSMMLLATAVTLVALGLEAAFLTRLISNLVQLAQSILTRQVAL